MTSKNRKWPGKTNFDVDLLKYLSDRNKTFTTLVPRAFPFCHWEGGKRPWHRVPWFQRFIFIIFIAKGGGKINLWLKAAIDSSSRANQFELGSDPDSVS
jgi:hypothetical protein